MKKLMGWLFGLVTVRVTGAQPEDFLNLCARENLLLWRMVRLDPFTLEVQVTGRQYPWLCRLAERTQCQVREQRRRGLPFFLKRFRRRYALLAGLVLFVFLALAGSQVILTIDVTGNQTITNEEIISQLRLCGVSVGTWGPSVPIRAVENKLMLAMDQLSFCSVNLYGTRAEVIVREVDPAPDLREEEVPTNVVSAATGIITQIEAWKGDAQFKEGDTVCQGEVLISGQVLLDPPPLVETDLGTMLVHAEGRVFARTWRTMTAQISLTAQGKEYTGETITRRCLSVMGQRMKFYQNSSVPYEKYDIITHLRSWTPVEGKTLPILWETTTYREYTLTERQLDPGQAEQLLRDALEESLLASLDQGKVLQKDFTVSQEGDVLSVTLLAQCDEQIGRLREMDTTEKVVGPRHPDKGEYPQDETNTKEQSP